MLIDPATAAGIADGSVTLVLRVGYEMSPRGRAYLG
jgi:hypothetical protein